MTLIQPIEHTPTVPTTQKKSAAAYKLSLVALKDLKSFFKKQLALTPVKESNNIYSPAQISNQSLGFIPVEKHYVYEFHIDKHDQFADTLVYCVVNKFNEIVNSTSYTPDAFPKNRPLYCFHLSQQDAIDFIYKVSKDRPRYFKSMGLGINSITLKNYLKNYLPNSLNKNTLITLVSCVEEYETFIKAKNLSFENVYKSPDANRDFNFDRNKSLFLAYRVKNIPGYFGKVEPEPEVNKLYLKLEDVMKDERVQKGLSVTIEVGRISELDLRSQQILSSVS